MAACRNHPVKFDATTDRNLNSGANMQFQFNSWPHLFLLAPIAVALSGCETMSKEECLSADWYQVGYQDGRDGKARSQIENIAKSCAKTNVIPDRERYFSGRNRGLHEYCTPEHGFYLGKDGASYNRVCPPESADSFEAAYNEGYRIYDARQRVRRLEEKRHALEDKLSKATSDEDKRHIRDDLDDLDRRLRFARDTLQFIENEALRFY